MAPASGHGSLVGSREVDALAAGNRGGEAFVDAGDAGAGGGEVLGGGAGAVGFAGCADGEV